MRNIVKAYSKEKKRRGECSEQSERSSPNRKTLSERGATVAMLLSPAPTFILPFLRFQTKKQILHYFNVRLSRSIQFLIRHESNSVNRRKGCPGLRSGTDRWPGLPVFSRPFALRRKTVAPAHPRKYWEEVNHSRIETLWTPRQKRLKDLFSQQIGVSQRIIVFVTRDHSKSRNGTSLGFAPSSFEESEFFSGKSVTCTQIMGL